jgi:squalene-hopene/tetraprenyl-beta-curcumene cyclase
MPREVASLHGVETAAEPGEGPLAVPAEPAIIACEQTPAGETAAGRTVLGTADEPLAPRLSLARSAEFLDEVTLGWIRQHQCASCHTGYPYLPARASLGDPGAPALREVRAFFEGRIAAWDEGGKGAGYLKGEGSVKETEAITEVLAIAATLALHDAQAGGRLHPRTRQALDRMWELQREDGSWPWNKTRLAPLEYDDYYGAVVAALGVGHAPEGYARTEAARQGVSRLRRYLRANSPPNLHHKTWLLWASVKLDGLMAPAERDRTVSELLALQRADGGRSLSSLGDWTRRDGTPNDKGWSSDGYATGLVVYVLRQADMPATSAPVRRGAEWLRTHQRASGRWFTRSLNGDEFRAISHAGTAYAVMALKACDMSGQ